MSYANNPSFDYPASVLRAQDAAAAYYDGTGLHMTDAEYDELLEGIASYEAAHPDEVTVHGLFDEVAAGTSAGGDVQHPARMLSLDKVTDEAGIRAFVARVAAEQTAAQRAADPVLTLTPKLDGMALRAVYRDGQLVQIVTRGNGRAGEDVTDRLMRDKVRVAGLPRSLGERDSFEVRGEMLMSSDDFRTSNLNRVAAGKTAFVNPRNATAGTVRAETLDYEVELTFVTYSHDGIPADARGFLFVDDLPGSASFATDDVDDLLASIEAFGTARADYDCPTDGVVIAVNSSRIRAELGEGSRAPKWAVAYKYSAVTGESVVRAIEVAVGRTGNLSFTAVFDPVFVDGSTISRASLHNVALIQDKDIRIGSVVEVQKNNDIIPQIVQVVTNSTETTPWAPPMEDADGFPYEMNGKFLRSTNPADSVSALITYAASRDVLDIDTLGRSVADALVEAGLVNDLADLFALTQADLAAMPFGESTFGETRAKTLYANIQRAKAQPLNRVITALGIRKTGRTFGRRLAAEYTSLGAFAQATRESLFAVEGVGDGRADFIMDGIAANRQVIARLIAAGIDPRVEEAAADAVLAGLAVCVTGSTKGTKLESYGRTQMQELIEQNGGRAASSVSKSTSLLVAGEGAGSKLAKAEELGIKTVTPDEFAVMLGLRLRA